MRELRVSLLGEGEVTYDAIGNEIIQPSKRDVFAKEVNVGQSEFFRAGQMGLKPERVILVWSFEYAGEQAVEMDGEVLHIYRTFARSDEQTELYLTKRMGDGYGV